MEGNAPRFQTTQIPEEVFGRVIKDPTFRADLLTKDPQGVLEKAHIYITEQGLAELKELIGLENMNPSLRALGDVEYW